MDPRMFYFTLLLGVCSVSASDTELNCTNPHEVPGCLFGCPPQRTCRNYKYAFPCAPPPPCSRCTPQCVCADGYARNLDGVCITIAQCEQCPGYTQHFACNGPYDENCSECSCVCDDGYARDANNTCVSTSPPPVIASPPPPPTGPSNPPTGPVNPVSTGPVGPPGIIPTVEVKPPTSNTDETDQARENNPIGETYPTGQTNPTW